MQAILTLGCSKQDDIHSLEGNLLLVDGVLDPQIVRNEVVGVLCKPEKKNINYHDIKS